LFVGRNAIVPGSETFEHPISYTLRVENVSKGGHGCLDPSLGDAFQTEFHFTDLSCTMDESFDRELLGTSQQFEGRHGCVGRLDGPRLLNDVSFRAQANHDVTLVFDFKQSCGPLVVFGMLCTTSARKPFGPDLASVIRSNMRHAFQRALTGRCQDDVDPEWFTRLAREVKFSSKGITKRRVKAPMTTFRHVLNTQRIGNGTLKGFRARNNGISTYEQTKNGFSYFYCKRRVLDDGVSTVPLDLELCPIKKDSKLPDV